MTHITEQWQLTVAGRWQGQASQPVMVAALQQIAQALQQGQASEAGGADPVAGSAAGGAAGTAADVSWRLRRIPRYQQALARYQSRASEGLPAGLCFGLFHGRRHPQQVLQDWGSDGPMVPVLAYHTTYNCSLRLRFANLALAREFALRSGLDEADVDEWIELRLDGGLLHFGDTYYGDWCVFWHEPAPPASLAG